MTQLRDHHRTCFLFIFKALTPPNCEEATEKHEQKKGASAQAHSHKVQCLKGCFQGVNHKAAGIPQTRKCLQQRLKAEEASFDIEHLLALQSRRNRQAC
jgi:hypothetical protein